MVLTSGLFIVVFYILNPNNFNSVIFIAIIFGGKFSIIPFTYDNYSKWNTYQYAFPVSKKIVVCSRYLFGLTLFSICLLLSIFSMLLTEIEYLLFCSDIFYSPVFQLYIIGAALWGVCVCVFVCLCEYGSCAFWCFLLLLFVFWFVF